MRCAESPVAFWLRQRQAGSLAAVTRPAQQLKIFDLAGTAHGHWNNVVELQFRSSATHSATTLIAYPHELFDVVRYVPALADARLFTHGNHGSRPVKVKAPVGKPWTTPAPHTVRTEPSARCLPTTRHEASEEADGDGGAATAAAPTIPARNLSTLYPRRVPPADAGGTPGTMLRYFGPSAAFPEPGG